MGLSLAEEAYRLVHSMNTSEKKYFKRSLVDRADGKLKAVFDVINSMTVFDQKLLGQEVRKKYSDTSAAYSQVIQVGLRSLASYNSKTWVEIELNNILIQARVSFEKKLIQTYEKLIDKGLALATANNLESYRYLFLEMTMTPRFELIVADIEHYRSLKDEMIALTEDLKVFAELDFQRLRLMWVQSWSVMNRQNWLGLQSEAARLGKVDVDRFIENGKLLAASRIYLVRSANYFMMGDWESALAISVEASRSLGDPLLLPDRVFLAWTGHLRNALNISKVLDRRQEFLDAYRLLSDAYEHRGQKVPEMIAIRRRLHEAGHLAHMGETDQALDVFDELMQENSAFLNMAELKCERAYLYFMKRDYKTVLSEVNTYLVGQEKSLDSKMIWSLRWLELFCAFMLADKGLFEAKKRSLTRMLKSNDSGFEWEGEILTTLRLSFGKQPEEQQARFIELLDCLTPVKQQVRSCFTIYDLFSWVGSMAAGVDEPEYLRSRYLSR